MRVIHIRTDDVNFLVCVTYGRHPKVPHEPEVVEVLCEDLIRVIIKELGIIAKISQGVISIDDDNERHYCILIETLDKPPIETIRLLEERINNLPPLLL